MKKMMASYVFWLILLSACTTTLKPTLNDAWMPADKNIKAKNIHYNLHIQYP